LIEALRRIEKTALGGEQQPSGLYLVGPDLISLKLIRPGLLRAAF